jgi:glucose/arabinose dehydrogenase/PKD repeat protein
MLRARALCFSCLCTIVSFLPIGRADGAASHAQQGAPPGFVDELVATLNPHDIPTGIALTPDGRVLITLQTGQLRIVQNGALLPTPALNLAGAICTDGERGLQSVAVDPGFAANSRIFVYYTAPNASGSCSGAVATNRVVRYTLANNVAQNPTPILTEIPTGGGFHNGGDLQFGADGMLYVSTGDGGSALGGGPNAINNDNARYPSLLLGKILRIAPDGSIPADNPYANAPGAVVCGGAPWNKNGGACKEVFATGLRNPFKIAFKHGTNVFHINDVGQNHWEEINLGQSGADYGWNLREGPCPAGSGGNCTGAPPALSAPIHSINHSNGFCSITGGAFANAIWPAPYADSYFFGNYCDRTIYRLVPAAGGAYTREAFHAAPGSGGTVALRFDPPTQSLYYSLADNFSVDGVPGVVRRIRSTVVTNRPPNAVASAAPFSGNAPVAVAFSAAGSGDPDGDTVTYLWTFGDGAAQSTAPNPVHTYTQNGRYTATLVLSDTAGALSNIATVVLNIGNAPPQPQIIAPGDPATFAVGDQLTLSGAAIDPEDGSLAGAALSWNVILHHVPENNPGNRHTHPFFSGTGSAVTLPTMPGPEDLTAARFGYFEIQLTATDSAGQQRTITRTLQPRLGSVTLQSAPPGLVLSVNEAAGSTPLTVTTWHGMNLQVAAASSQILGGQTYQFGAWSDNGAATHAFIAPPGAMTLTASYSPVALPTATPPAIPTATAMPPANQNTLVSEAEALPIRAPIAISADPSASGGQFVQAVGVSSASCPAATAGSWFTHTFTLASAGSVRFWGRTIAPSAGADSFCLRLDSGPVTIWTLTNSTGWLWQPVAIGDVKTGIASLSAGQHTLAIHYREVGARLDKLFVTTDLVTTPTGFGPPSGATSTATPIPSPSATAPPVNTPTPTAVSTATPGPTQTPAPAQTITPTPTRTPTAIPTLTPIPSATPAASASQYIEAEALTLSAPMISAADAGASGGRFVWSGTTPSASCPTSFTGGGWATWTVSVPSAATYALWLRTSAPNTASDSLCVQIDNGSVQTWGTPLSSGWVWTRQNGYALSSGTHTIRIRYRERGTRLDRLFLSSTSATP